MRLYHFILASLCLSVAGCSDGEITHGDSNVLGLSTHELIIGQTVEIYAKNLDQDAVSYRLSFTGRYENDFGEVENVMVSQSPILDGQVEIEGETFDILRINRFGPYGNPFSEVNRPGVFTGRITLFSVDTEGVLTELTSKEEMQIRVGPSIIIEEFQPIEAQCGNPALRGLAGLTYRLQVRAAGIKPIRFTYEISSVNGVTGTTNIVHDYESPVETDAVGDREPLVFNPIPDNEQFYATGLRIIAEDADGLTVETAMPLTIHRPIEVRLLSKESELAERYAPEPVSGCMKGSISTRVRYNETRSQSRQRTVGMTVSTDWSQAMGASNNQDWQEGISEGVSVSRSLRGSSTERESSREAFGLNYTNSEANRMNMGTTDGESWGWNRREGESNEEYQREADRLYGSGTASTTVGASGEGSIPGFAKVSGRTSTTVGVKVGGGRTWDEGVSRSNSTTRGHSMGSNSSETRSFGSTMTDAESQSIAGAFSLATSQTRSLENMSARENSRTWDFSGSMAESSLITEGISESERATWSESSQDRVIRNFSGTIPRSGVGVFYRQTSRYVRRAEIRSYDQCGIAQHVGELQMSDWQWAMDLALGDSCDDGLPESSLEPYVCLIGPCG